MRRLFPLILILAACGGESSTSRLSSTPVSVRGWIAEITPAGTTLDSESIRSRKYEFIADTTVSVENVEFASGGVSEMGAFVVLDVPPGSARILFNAPGAQAPLILENVPGNADVLVPGLVLRGTTVMVQDPSKIRIRVPGDGPESKPTGQKAKVAGVEVPVVAVPVTELADRREYPEPGQKVIGTVPLR